MLLRAKISYCYKNQRIVSSFCFATIHLDNRVIATVYIHDILGDSQIVATVYIHDILGESKLYLYFVKGKLLKTSQIFEILTFLNQDFPILNFDILLFNFRFTLAK